MRWTPRGYGGERRPPETVKQDGWREQGLLAVSIDDQRLPPPSPAAISRMEEALLWLRWLEAEDAKLVWARADHTPWKAICWQFGMARATANRRFQYALSVIAWRLNGQKIPEKRSKQFIVLQRS